MAKIAKCRSNWVVVHGTNNRVLARAGKGPSGKKKARAEAHRLHKKFVCGKGKHRKCPTVKIEKNPICKASRKGAKIRKIK